MKITDAADYDKITLTVKKEGETWKLKIVGEKTDKVQITGVFNGWSQVDMVSNPNGTYTYEVEENMAALSRTLKKSLCRTPVRFNRHRPSKRLG